MPMPQLLYFQPDPQIPDADMLGYGDLIYDDGRTEWLDGDPETAMGLPRPPQQGAGGLQMPQPADLGNGLQVDAMGNILQGGQPVAPLGGGDFWGEPEPEGPGDPLPLPGQPQNNKFGGFGADDPTGPALPPAGTVAPDMGGGPQPITVQGEQGPMTISPDGSIQPGAGGIPFEQAQAQAQQQGFQPFQREGALPPDVAQRQIGALDASQQQTLGLTEQARRDEARMMAELTMKQLAQNEAMRIEREEEIATEQAKVQRWQQEQQATIDMEIETDLISAKGGGASGAIGAVFAVLGATLLGGAGSDAGLRMIENSIDRHIRQQVSRRDTKLGLLSQQIGSSMQAVSLGKAALYKVAADRAELLAQKTKSDVYEAQTPAVVQQLRQKQLENLQAAEQQSMGKLIERVSSPSVDRISRAAYGEASAAQSQAELNTLRALRAIGGQYDPKTGKITNRDQILKDGIPGVGRFDTFMNELGKIPVVGALPQATDSAITSQEGQDVRSALQSLIEAEAMRLNPGRAPTDADRDAARRSLGLNTEKGVIDALERTLGDFDRQRAQNVATFGPGAAQTVEGTMGALGQARGPLTAPANVRSLSPGNARQQLQQERERSRQPQQGEPTSMAEPTPEEFQNSLAAYAEQEGLNPEAVARVVRHESGGKPGAVNPLTSKHAGLIQFSKDTWAGLAKDAGVNITWDEMRQMSAEEQLPFVMQYFSRLGLSAADDPGQYALGAFFPMALNEPDDFVIGRKGSAEKLGGLSMAKIWQQNPGLRNGDVITAGDVRRSVL
jgi:hypothetical protein